MERQVRNDYFRTWLYSFQPTVLSTVALMLQCCVCLSGCLSVQNVLWLNGASWSQSYYWQPIGSRIWEIDWYRNEWPWPPFRGRVKVMWTISWHSTLNISETLEIEAWFQRTTNRKWPMGYPMVTWPMTSRDPERSNSWPQYALS